MEAMISQAVKFDNQSDLVSFGFRGRFYFTGLPRL